MHLLLICHWRSIAMRTAVSKTLETKKPPVSSTGGFAVYVLN
jgi:hypothetical protein